MMFFSVILVSFFFFSSIQCLQLGTIFNAGLQSSTTVGTMMHPIESCSECVCKMVMSLTQTNNSRIFGLNCFQNESRCELFYNLTSTYTLAHNLSSTFYCVQLPSLMIQTDTTTAVPKNTYRMSKSIFKIHPMRESPGGHFA
jgi:hypothetical protein